MTDNDQGSVRREYVAKLILITVFLGGLAAFIGYMTVYGPGWDAFQLTGLQLILLGLSAYRLGRMVAYDRVMEPLRQFFADTRPDPTGAGDTVEPKGKGFQQAVGQLITCPICAGTWISAALVYLLYLFPGPTQLFLTMTAAIGLGELFGALTEALCWSGQYGRVMSGAKMREQEALRQQEQPTPIELPGTQKHAERYDEQTYYPKR